MRTDGGKCRMALPSATVALVVLLQVSGGTTQQDSEYENYGKTVAGIEKCGFVGERHEVASRDGYSTAAFRMLQPGGGAGAEPVLLQHGLLASSDAWFQLADASLPCLLAAAGYDVWLHNLRGNSYSKAHNTFNTETIQFWAFSFHEMAVNDLAATIDYIRSLTNAEKVSFVGHSMGGTLIFVLLSVLPEYNKKIGVSVSFAPVCFMGHTTSHLLKLLAYVAPYFEKPLNWMSNGEIAPFPDFQGTKSDFFNFQIGAALGEVIDFNQMLKQEMTLDAETSGYLTDGTSLRTVLHLAQLITRGNFSWYDFGKRNSIEYKQTTPPNYNLRRITATQIIMYSEADHLVVEKDVKRLCSELPEGVGVCIKINKTGFRHADFLSSYDAQEHVYNAMLGETEPETNETQGKSSGSPIRGRAATLPAGDWPPPADEGAPPARGRAATPAMRLRAPSPPEQPQVGAPPVREEPTPPPEQAGPGSSPEEDTVPRPPEAAMAETSTRPAGSSPEKRPGKSTGRVGGAAAQARGRIASRVRGMAAEPEGAASTEGGVAAAPPERKAGAQPRARGPAATAAPRPGDGENQDQDPTAPVKVCRYYATAGRLQRICYEEYA